MKKYLSSILILAVIAGISGCGDNKTKNKLVGTTVLDSTTAGGASSFLASPPATSMTAMYKTAFIGAGAGNFSYAMAPSRHALLMMGAPSSDQGLGLGTPNASGEYTIADTLGMSVKIVFKEGGVSGENVYMDFSKMYSGSTLYLYCNNTSFASVHSLVRGSTPDSEIGSWFLGHGNHYIASPWIRVASSLPMAWYQCTMVKLQGGLTDLESFIFSNFPSHMVVTANGAIPGGTVSLTQTTAMPSARPTDANPATMTGSGTVTFTTGEVWTLSSSMSIGVSGPIGGTMSYTSSTGETGTMTFNANGSMDGVQRMSGVTVGTIHINADGTGTYTDKDGKSFAISGARPK